MNPYAPPTVAMAASPEPSQVSLKNPARFLLYPLAALCILFFIAMEWHHWHNSFKFRTVDFLNAGAGALIGLFGFTALVLGSRKLSKNTRVLTMLWSFAGGSILVDKHVFRTTSFASGSSIDFADWCNSAARCNPRVSQRSPTLLAAE